MRRRFWLKVVLFSSTTLLPLAVGKLLVPLDWYTFRVWETLVDQRPTAPGMFYPNQHLRKVEEGDLGARTRWAVKKSVEWYTDAYGFRNRPSTHPPDVVIVGDSFVVGTSLSQADTLAERLAARSGLSVYALSSLTQFRRDERFQRLPPRALIFTELERNLQKLGPVDKFDGETGAPDEPPTLRGRLQRTTWRLLPPAWSIALDQIRKKPLLTEHIYRLMKRRPPLYAVVNREQGWLFAIYDFDAARLYQAESEQYIHVARLALVDHQRTLAARGIPLIFMAIPDKADIYWQFAPPEQTAGLQPPQVLPRLNAALRQDGIPTVDLYGAFHRAVRDGTQIYHPDDSHWAPAGVGIAAELLTGELRTMGLLAPPASDQLAAHEPQDTDVVQ